MGWETAARITAGINKGSKVSEHREDNDMVRNIQGHARVIWRHKHQDSTVTSRHAHGSM